MPQSTEGVLLVIGALFFLIGLLGGGFEVSAIKIPSIEKYPRAVLLVMGIGLLLVGMFRILFPGAPPVVPATNTAVAVVTLPLPTPTPLPPVATPTSAALATTTPGSQPGVVATSAGPAASSPTVSSIWRQGDIVAQASLASVAGVSFALRLTLTNEGASNFSARFRMEDATAKDDSGETYASGSQAGQRTDSIGPNQSRTYTFFFNGTLNPAAKKLTFQLTPLSNLSNLTVEVPLGRDTAALRLAASLVNAGDTSIRVSFAITNESANDFIAQFRGGDISLTDDIGNIYALSTSPTLTVDLIAPNQSRNYSFFFKGPLNPNAKKLILRLAQFSGTTDVKVDIPTNQ